ncbi:hypothetical protein [Acetonema longum]|uniref:Uncharacterized protein n=1 Tax=Acetonema longum DSM 6540 TaxID=1009370 RepID=F7NHS3_9FIRM|nr:hypothetical protein [Acetonema longum]EGO64448.1 hypothetical protein ALO_08103 [Acetonema longum DSM 6540]
MARKYLVIWTTCMLLMITAVTYGREQPAPNPESSNGSAQSAVQTPQPPVSTEFGDVKITVGQSKEEALRRLGRVYQVTQVMSDNSEEELWSVTTREGDTFQTVGTITVKNNKIVRIQKNLGNFQNLDQTKVLIQAMRNAAKSGNQATLIISQKEESGKRHETITLHFSDRKLVISIIEFPGVASGVIMYELLEETNSSNQSPPAGVEPRSKRK